MLPSGIPRRRATLTSVADRAGVSRQTVSNVLHSPDVVQQATRERVLTAIRELDYRPNLAARQMRTSRSQTVAVRIQPSRDGVNSVVLDRFMHALCLAAEQNGYHLVVFTAADDAAEIAALRRLRSTLNIDGFVLVGTHAGDHRVTWLTGQQIPFVAFGRPWHRGPRPHSSVVADGAGHAWVDVDGAAGTRAATRMLLDAGHHRIAFLGWRDSTGVGDDREAGWRRALAEAGVAGPAVVLRGADDISDGARLAGQLRAEHPEVTAAVCVSDSLAIGAWRAHAGDRSIALTGFDNTAAAAALGLTSVAQPLETAAFRCFDLLHRLLLPVPADRGAPALRPGHPAELLEPTLVVRPGPPSLSGAGPPRSEPQPARPRAPHTPTSTSHPIRKA